MHDDPNILVALQPTQLAELLDALRTRGYRLIGPTARDAAIVYDVIESIDDLPRGLRDRQGPGTYSLEQRGDEALFGFTIGPTSWRRFFQPPEEVLWTARRSEDGFTIEEPPADPMPLAILGARGCDLAALRIHDRVLGGGNWRDERFVARRKASLVIAVECTVSAATCFCASRQTGPAIEAGYDICLTEVITDDEHYLLARSGSQDGAELLALLDAPQATDEQIAGASASVQRAADAQTRALPEEGLRELVLEAQEDPIWEDIASRCLSCANCTLVCPTCFCTDVEEVSDLAGEEVARKQRWDSCFTPGFSYLHGGPVRKTTAARYRQWLSHKLATWHDQFSSSGCVGCGRCITWCPVGIDLTEEIARLRTPANTTTTQE